MCFIEKEKVAANLEINRRVVERKGPFVLGEKEKENSSRRGGKNVAFPL